MVKKLSEQLADLSVRAKSAEDAVSAAEKEAHDKVAARTEQARVSAAAAIDNVNRDIKSAEAKVAKDWSAVKAKVEADMKVMKARVAGVKHDFDAKRANNRADELEWEAGVAIDYAIASVEQAKLAVLDAIDGRLAAQETAGA